MNGGWPQYTALFVVSSFGSLFLTPVAWRFALRRRILDEPGGHKSHQSPIPYLGGLAIVMSFALAVLGAAVVNRTGGEDELFKVVGVALAMAFLGLIDDLRGLSPLIRLIAELAAGVAVWSFDLGVKFLPNDALNALATVVWVAGLINAFNMVDNMDGLSAGLTAIASGSYFAIAAANGQYLVASLSIAVAGCAVGFLRHNFFPARIYMGDSGAYFFGFMIAYLGLKLQFITSPSNNTFLVPVVACSVVIGDLLLVTVTRIMRGSSPFSGGRDHTSHRLVRLGLPVPVAVLSIYSGAAMFGAFAFVMARVDDVSAWILFGLCVAIVGLFGLVLARVPVDDA